MKKGSVIVIILVVVIIVTIAAAGSILSIKLLKEKLGKETEGKNFIEIAQEYLKEKLGKKSKIGEKNLAEKTKETIAKKTVIDVCKKQTKTEDRNACFTGVAIYYKDPSMCEYITTQEDRNTCQKNIEDYNKAMEEKERELAKLSPEEREQLEKIQESDYLKQISEKMSSMSEEQIKNMSPEEYQKYIEQLYQIMMPGFKLETPKTSEGTGTETGGGGGGVTEEIYELWEERLKENEPYIKEVEALSDDVKVEYSALIQYANYLYGKEGIYSSNATRVMERVDEIQKKNNISEEASQMIMTVVAGDPALQSRVEERYNELLKQGLK